jgi:glycosyltransferase involved in cell wall biosynthesis
MKETMRIAEERHGAGARALEAKSRPPDARPRIASISIEYPNAAEPGLGLFVRSRLQQMGTLADVKVISPVALVNYSDPHRKLLRSGVIPHSYADQNLSVIHPRWTYPPFGTPANILCLCAAILPHLIALKKSFDFQIIDSHFGYPDGVAAGLAAALVRVPFMMTLRGNEPVFAASSIRRRCLQWALPRAARVITVSPELAEFAISLGADPRRVVTIGNGVDTDNFFPRSRTACRLCHGVAQDRKVIFTAASLVEMKGHQHVVRAVHDLAAQGVDVELIIAGSASRAGASYEGALRQLIAGLGIESRVRLLGWIAPADLPEWLSAADVFCLASDSEGWPNVVHEALSCGTPVIATRVGAVPKLIPSEQYGETVAVGDQAALTLALRHALEKSWDRNSISEWGHFRSWKQVAREVIAEVQEVLNECVE